MDAIIAPFNKCTIADRKRARNQRIPFLVNGTMQVMKTVSKNTTCNDVIAKLPNMTVPLAVYESVDGVERELPGKTKLLKLWRGCEPSKTVTFTVRKTERAPSNKRRSILGLNISRRHKTPVKTATELAQEQLKKVSDLAVYSRFQKAKILAMQINSANDLEPMQRADNGLTRQFASSASLSSMDAFLSRVNLGEMAELMNFCSDVSVKFLERNVKQKKIGQCTNDDTYDGEIDETREEVQEEVQTTENNNASPKPTRLIDINKIKDSLKTKKLGLKSKFSTLGKSKSSSSIRSTDTGYHSVESKGDNEYDDNGNKRDSIATLTATCVEDGDFTKRPRHSTPSTSRSARQYSNDIDVTLTADSVDQYTENGGKSVIFNKFMTDHSLECYQPRKSHSMQHPVSGDNLSENVTIRGTSSNNARMFNSQKEKCEFYWSSNCDSDSDSSFCQSDISSNSTHHLDTAFVEISNCGLFEEPVKTLRRESAVSDLRKHSIDQSHVRGHKTTMDFDYSFDCSFPQMEEFQSANFSDSSSDTDDNYSQDDLDTHSESSADDLLDSFMRTRSTMSISDDDLDVTVSADLTGYTNASSCTFPLLKRKRLVTFGEEIII